MLTKTEQAADISAGADASALEKPQLIEKIEPGCFPAPRAAAMQASQLAALFGKRNIVNAKER